VGRLVGRKTKRAERRVFEWSLAESVVIKSYLKSILDNTQQALGTFLKQGAIALPIDQTIDWREYRETIAPDNGNRVLPLSGHRSII